MSARIDRVARALYETDVRQRHAQEPGAGRWVGATFEPAVSADDMVRWFPWDNQGSNQERWREMARAALAAIHGESAKQAPS